VPVCGKSPISSCFAHYCLGIKDDQKIDILGRTYEYCIAQFAAKEGKGGGEFYTPSSVLNTLVAVLKPYSNCRVYENKTQNWIQFNDCSLRGVA
jgi:hypothetical protein